MRLATIFCSIFLLILLPACGKIIELVNDSVDVVKNQQRINDSILQRLEKSPTSNDTALCNDNLQSQKQNNATPIYLPTPKKQAPELTITADRSDLILNWTDVGADTYTVYQNFVSPAYENCWRKTVTFRGTTMTFPCAVLSGTHWYKVTANFEDGVIKTSIPICSP